MSFILDALKKSETDRQRQSAPALFEVKVAAPRRRFPHWAVGLGLLLAVNVLVLVWVLLRDPAPVTAPTAATSPPASGTAQQPALTVPATVTITANIPVNSPAVATAPAPEPGVVAPSAAPPLAEEPMLSGTEPSIPPDYDTRDYQPAITPSQAGAMAERRAGLPTRDEALSQGLPLPPLRLDLHVFSEIPAERFVFINMRKLREGDISAEGVRVEEITQIGARLSFRGTQFLLEGN